MTEPNIIWDVPVRLRADFLFYKGPGLQGSRKAVRLYLQGRKGQVQPGDISSLVVRAPHGTRVTLMTHAGDDWLEHAWRTIRLVQGFTVAGDKTPLPGVRIPDLDFLHGPDTKRSTDDYQESYPLVATPTDGTGWTFGGVGAAQLKGHVRKIRVEREAG